MSDSAVRPTPTEVEPSSVARTPRARAWDRARFILIAGWLAVLVALPMTSHKASSWAHLRGLVAAGKVTSVEINGELPPGTNGFSTVEIRWKHGLLHYVTYVRQAHVREDVESEPADDDVSATVTTAPSARLLSSQSGLHLSGGGNASYSGSRILGFEAPGWLWLTSAVLMAATVVLLVKGPPLWRATRWAWFWLLASPIGMAAFLLLSGPFPGLPKPRSANRLTGGWAFLLSIVVKSLSITLWGITLSS